MTCHGVTKELTVPVKATYLAGKLNERMSKMTGDLLVLRSSFSIKRTDFGIKPDMTDKVVAEEIQVRVAIAGVSPKK
jgi:polyisoprenoid-binding protein YceI